jgi:hypothetical protein
MRNIILLFLTIYIFTGCGKQPVPMDATYTVNETEIYSGHSVSAESINMDKGLFKITSTQPWVMGRTVWHTRFINPIIGRAHQIGRNLDYKYFQIVAPSAFSNYKGFPINNTADMRAYLNPKLNVYHDQYGSAEMFLSYRLHPSINKSMFGANEFTMVVRFLNNPQPNDIVWKVEDRAKMYDKDWSKYDLTKGAIGLAKQLEQKYSKPQKGRYFLTSKYKLIDNKINYDLQMRDSSLNKDVVSNMLINMMCPFKELVINNLGHEEIITLKDDDGDKIGTFKLNSETCFYKKVK